MSETSQELVVLFTHGADHELSSVGFTIANGGMTAGLKVSAFLTSAVPGEGGPQPFYEKLGFVPTGQIDDGEVVLRLEL